MPSKHYQVVREEIGNIQYDEGPNFCTSLICMIFSQCDKDKERRKSEVLCRLSGLQPAHEIRSLADHKGSETTRPPLRWEVFHDPEPFLWFLSDKTRRGVGREDEFRLSFWKFPV